MQRSINGPLIVGAALVAVWAVLGIADLASVPYSGMLGGGNNNVRAVLPGSPAETAGLQPGDQIVSIDGISTADARAAARRSRAQIGETRVFVVERDPGLGALAGLAVFHGNGLHELTDRGHALVERFV